MMTREASSISIASASRCPWAATPALIDYHDREWGVPLHEDRLLFEFLTLEGAQAGLSWSTILNKRGNYRRAFANFRLRKIAAFDETDIELLLQNPGIVRNRLKIRAAVQNARSALAIQDEFKTFDAYLWNFVAGRPITNNRKTMTDVPARSPESDFMSTELKRRGFRFVGSTICYAFMQATGMVNDHLVSCFRHAEVGRLTR